jgi:type I restriction enzyme, S subunit
MNRTFNLQQLESDGKVKIGRGRIISRSDLNEFPGEYPVYSSSAKGTGEFGKYGRYDFESELITWSIDGGGRLFHREPHRFSITNVCGYIQQQTPDIDLKYLHAVLEAQHEFQSFDYQLKAHPSVIKKLYTVILPDISEQKAIAHLIRCAQDAEKALERHIFKQERVRAGLLQALLTRGVDENGEIRQAHSLVEDDGNGMKTPKEWRISTVKRELDYGGGRLQTGPFGTQIKSKDYVDRGIYLLNPQDIVPAGYISLENAAQISEETATMLSRHKLLKGDLLISRRGGLDRLAHVSTDDVGLCGTGCMLMRWRNPSVDARWFCLAFRSAKVQRILQQRAVGTTMINLNSALILELELPFPSIEEQNRILNTIDMFESSQRISENKLEKLKRIKTGLVRNLLSGRVSVEPLLAELTPQP